MIEGISPKKEEEVQVTKIEVEDTKMSVSHLLTKGYVESNVKEGIISARFKSLTTEQVHETDSMVVALYGVNEHRASKNARYIKYLAKSLVIAHLDVENEITTWDFSGLKEEAKEEALSKMSSFVFNKLFSLYMKFEGMVSELLNSVDVKKS